MSASWLQGLRERGPRAAFASAFKALRNGPSRESAARDHVLRNVLVAGLVVSAATAADFLLGKAKPNPRFVTWTLEMGLFMGMFTALWVSALQTVLIKRRWFITWTFWLLVASYLAWWLIDDLGVVARIGGKDHKEAVKAFWASIGAGTVFLGIMVVAQPRTKRPKGWLGGLRWYFKIPLILLMFAGAAALVWVDRNFKPHAYRKAHLTLRVLALLAAHYGLVAALSRFRPRAHGLWLVPWIVLIMFSVEPMFSITRSHEREVETMLRRPYPRVMIKAIRKLGDPDRDGYSAVLGGGDCNSFNADIRPGVREIPGNGIDDNCLLGDAEPIPIEAEAEIPIPQEPSEMSVVLITVDTVVAPRLSLYSRKKDRRTSPKLERWAKGAAVFERAFTSGGWTSLALSSMFRGLYPRRLHWTGVYETKSFRLLTKDELDDEPVRLMFGLPKNDPRITFPALLQRRGMYTAAVVNDLFSEFLEPGNGLVDGFDEYIDMDDFSKGMRKDKGVTDVSLKVLGEVPEDKEFFFWVHYFGPHTPSQRHKGIKRFGNSVVDRYDHELLYWDREVSRLLTYVDRMAKKRPITVIIASDHGEVFTKRARFHGSDPKATAMRIPILIKGPGIKAGRYKGVASLVDVMPTVLALTGTPGPTVRDGVDLRDIVNGNVEDNRILMFDTWRLDKEGDFKRNYVVAMDGDHKYVWNLVSEAKALRKQGPRERVRNLLGKVDGSHLRAAVEQYIELHGPLEIQK